MDEPMMIVSYPKPDPKRVRQLATKIIDKLIEVGYSTPAEADKWKGYINE